MWTRMPNPSSRNELLQLGTDHGLLAAESAVGATCLVINGDQAVDSRIVRDTIANHDTDSAATLALL